MTLKVLIAYGGEEAKKVALDLFQFLERNGRFKPVCIAPETGSMGRGTLIVDIGRMILECDASVWICTKESIRNRKFKEDLAFLTSVNIDMPKIPFVRNNVTKDELPYPLSGYWYGLKFEKGDHASYFRQLAEDIVNIIEILPKSVISKEV